MIISIGGFPGSGKSTFAKKLAEKLGFKRYYTGDFFRNLAKEKGISTAELGKLAEQDDSIDKELDERQEKLGKEEDNFVIEGRTAFHFIPHSFKIFLDVDLRVAAHRVFLESQEEGKRHEEGQNDDEDHVYEKMLERIESEKKRYEKIYGIDHTDMSNYDLVYDTTTKDPEQVFDELYDMIKDFL